LVSRRILLFSFFHLTALALTASALFMAPTAEAAKIDVVAETYHVVDGDTIDAFPVGRIRVADIDTPESGQAGYAEAKAAMRGYVEGERVYLDVDEVDVDDNYQRLVAVVYVRHNATHLLNVNKALVDAGLAVVDDFPNEFDPGTWSLYLRVPGPDLPTLWDDARIAYTQVSADLTAAEGALAAAQASLADAEAERDAALAELERVSAFLNGSVPAAADVLEELNATLAELETSELELAATQGQLGEAQAALGAAEAEQAAERETLQGEVAGANSSATLALLGGLLAAAGSGAGAFFVGRRRR